MKKKKIAIIVGFIISFLFVAYFVFAQGENACGFYGTLQIDGANAPLGTSIVAYIGGNPVTTQGGMIQDGVYVVNVFGGNNGDPVTFKIDGTYDATPQGTWQAKGNFQLNLVVNTGGGGGGTTCDIGNDCSKCTDWVTINGKQVRDSGVGYYDQACCGTTITQIITF